MAAGVGGAGAGQLTNRLQSPHALRAAAVSLRPHRRVPDGC